MSPLKGKSSHWAETLPSSLTLSWGLDRTQVQGCTPGWSWAESAAPEPTDSSAHLYFLRHPQSDTLLCHDGVERRSASLSSGLEG